MKSTITQETFTSEAHPGWKLCYELNNTTHEISNGKWLYEDKFVTGEYNEDIATKMAHVLDALFVYMHGHQVQVRSSSGPNLTDQINIFSLTNPLPKWNNRMAACALYNVRESDHWRWVKYPTSFSIMKWSKHEKH